MKMKNELYERKSLVCISTFYLLLLTQMHGSQAGSVLGRPCGSPPGSFVYMMKNDALVCDRCEPGQRWNRDKSECVGCSGYLTSCRANVSPTACYQRSCKGGPERDLSMKEPVIEIPLTRTADNDAQVTWQTTVATPDKDGFKGATGSTAGKAQAAKSEPTITVGEIYMENFTEANAEQITGKEGMSVQTVKEDSFRKIDSAGDIFPSLLIVLLVIIIVMIIVIAKLMWNRHHSYKSGI